MGLRSGLGGTRDGRSGFGMLRGRRIECECVSAKICLRRTYLAFWFAILILDLWGLCFVFCNGDLELRGCALFGLS